MGNLSAFLPTSWSTNKIKKALKGAFFILASRLAYLMVAKSEPDLNLTTFFAGILISFLV